MQILRNKYILFNSYHAIKIVAVIVILSSIKLYAQSESTYSTDEIIISASRYIENINSVNQAISIVPSNLIEINNPLNLANSLVGNVGIWVQQTNHGGGSPFLRGLTGNQTLILVDGIRLNNSTFRYGPNQYLNTFNVNDIDRIEILRGSGSVQYGSDALGGVVHLLTKSPKIGLSKNVNSGLQLKYLSSNMEKSTNAYIDYSTSTSGYHASMSYKRFGDLIAGGNLGKESPSSYEEYSFNLKNLHMISEKILLTYNYQFLRQNDINRFDQVNQRGFEYYKFDPQIRHLAYLKSDIFVGNKYAKKINLTFSWQQSSETRKTKKREEEFGTTSQDVVDTWGASLSVLTQPQKNWIINSGIEYYYDNIKSHSTVFNFADLSKINKRGLYSNGSKSHSLSIFSLSNIKIKNYEIGFGARYNLASLVIKDEIFGQPKINPDALTGYLSLAYNIDENFKLISKVNSAYRIPNINDVSSFGLFDYGIEVPNNNLLPERSINYEVGMKLNTSKIKASVFLFRSNLQNLIDRVKAEYNNAETYNGEFVYKKENTGKAFIEGVEFEITYAPIKNLIFRKNTTFTYGRNISKNEPMRRIPPLNGAFSILYTPSLLLNIRIEYLYAFKQNRLSSGDIDDHRIDDNGTPGWNVVNIYSDYDFGFINVGFGINNIFDQEYRMHGSGIDGIGRSFQLIGKYNY